RRNMSRTAIKAGSKGQIGSEGYEEPNEPRIIVQRPEGGNEQSDPCRGTAEHGCGDSTPTPFRIDAVLAIEIRNNQFAAAHDPVIGDQHSGDRSQTSRIA